MYSSSLTMVNSFDFWIDFDTKSTCKIEISLTFNVISSLYLLIRNSQYLISLVYCILI